MKATITRTVLSPKSTIGAMAFEGQFQCFTEEPIPPHRIPAGNYDVELLWSTRFQRVTPHVLSVPGFTAIEWHPGNYPYNTEGCTLVGLTKGLDFVGHSVEAFHEIMLHLPPFFQVQYIDNFPKETP